MVRKSAAVSVPIRFRRLTELVFEFSPGPQPVAEVFPGSADTRTLGIAVERPRFVQAP
jgi:hypothetical protein